jgi:hypothetical protein
VSALDSGLHDDDFGASFQKTSARCERVISSTEREHFPAIGYDRKVRRATTVFEERFWPECGLRIVHAVLRIYACGSFHHAKSQYYVACDHERRLI